MIKTVILIQIGLYVFSWLLTKLRSINQVEKKKRNLKETIRILIIVVVPFVGMIVMLQSVAMLLFLSDEQLVRILNKGKVKFEVVE